VSGVSVQVSAPPMASGVQPDQKKETNERRTSNVQHRTSNNVFCLLWIFCRTVYFNTTERHAAQAPALRERFHHSTFVNRHSSFIEVSHERRPPAKGQPVWSEKKLCKIKSVSIYSFAVSSSYSSSKLLRLSVSSTTTSAI